MTIQHFSAQPESHSSTEVSAGGGAEESGPGSQVMGPESAKVLEARTGKRSAGPQRRSDAKLPGEGGGLHRCLRFPSQHNLLL